ncbi:ABC transporter permease subunit [Mycoplasma corogypsi]|uniref:ABC transporter permease subunit n=1 Tax=Mycoplasma corogypsi TaxID=2106 RepID=UPI0038737D92
MEKLKLYNWYGEEFESKLPESVDTLKAYKKQVNNVFNRLTDNIKTRNNIDKDLFLRARNKIEDNLKRELASFKIAYKNKLKVLKDSVAKLVYVESIQSLLKFELKKLQAKKKYNKKYVEDFVISLKNLGDSLEDKLRNIEQLKEKTNKTDAEIAKIYCLYRTILVYTNNFSDRDFDLSKINHLLDPFEIKLLDTLENKNLYVKSLYVKIESRRISLLNKRRELQRKYQSTVALQKELYLKERQNIILSANKRLLEIEGEYNQKREQAALNANEYKRQALLKVEEHKEQILAAERKNKAKIDKIYENAALARKTLKSGKKQAIYAQKQKAMVKLYKDFYAFLIEQEVSVPELDFEALSKLETSEALNTLKSKTDAFINESSHKLVKLAYKHYFSAINIYHVKSEAKSVTIAKYNELLAATYKSYSYESEFKLEVSDAYKNWAKDAYLTRNKFLQERVLAKYELLKLYTPSEPKEVTDQKLADLKQTFETKKSGVSAEEAKELDKEYLEQFRAISSNASKVYGEKLYVAQVLKEIKAKYLSDLQTLKTKLQNREISKQAYKNRLVEIRIAKKEAKYELKLSSKVLKNKETLKTSFIRQLAERKINKKIFDSKINEAQKSIPVETSLNVKRFTWLLGFFFPGLPEVLFFKQYFKGALLLLFTAFNYIVFLPFILGYYGDQMNGIFGASDLGASHNKDARYYLLGSVISVILLSFMLIYFTVSSINAYRVSKALYYGNRPSRWSHSRRWLQTSGFPWMISIVGWVLMIFVIVAPVITSVLLSFTNIGFNHIPPNKTVDWVGLEQWGRWWTLRDANLLGSISNVLTWTFIWTITSTLIPIGLGILVAILTNNSRIVGRKIFRIIFILPWAIPVFVTVGFIKSMFAAGETGYINTILFQLFGLNPKSWLNDIQWTRALLIVVQTWIGYAWIFMLVTGNLQSIPKDIYEAGSVDGAKGKHLFWYLTLPSLLLSISPMLIGLFVGAFNNFTTIYLFNGGGPNYANPTPFGEGSTDIIVSWVYKLSNPNGVQFEGNQAFGAALATLASIFSIGIALKGFIKTMSRRD